MFRCLPNLALTCVGLLVAFQGLFATSIITTEPDASAESSFELPLNHEPLANHDDLTLVYLGNTNDEDSIGVKAPGSAQMAKVGGGQSEAGVKSEQGTVNEPAFLERTFMGRYYENLYPHISHVLEKSLPDVMDLDANLEQAREWLAIELEQGIDWGNRWKVNALKQFLELAKLNQKEKQCSLEAQEIIYKNDKATQGRARARPSKLKPLTRVDQLVHLAARRHSKACLEVYRARYDERSSLFGQPVKRLLMDYLDSGLLNCRGCVASGQKNLCNSKAVDQAYQFIETNSRADLERKRIVERPSGPFQLRQVDVDQVRTLAKRYIIEPCQEYVSQLGLDVYVPARYSMFVLEPSERYQSSNPEHSNFLHGWNHYRLCESLVRRDQETLVKNLVAKYQLALSRGELQF